MSGFQKMSHGQRHWWIRAGLLKQGFDKPVADMIANRYFMGRTLFPNERAAVEQAIIQLEKQV